MKKILKMSGMVLCFLFILFTMSVTKSYGEDKGNNKAAVHINVPEDWENPCVWAWDTEGNNVFSSWPGGICDELTGNDGWYYIWVPVWADHIIINANDGNVQTGELTLEGKNTWITVKSAEDVEISYDSLTVGETPAYVEKYPVHIKVDESWENPQIMSNSSTEWVGTKLKEDKDGWHISNIPVSVKKILISAKNGELKTDEFKIDAAEIWITVDKNGEVYYTYKDPNQVQIENITVYAKTPEDWENPCLWAWSAPDGTNAFVSWPGENLEEKDGWYSKEVPGWINSIIINGNKGKVQTSDISVETGKDIWVIVSDTENYEVLYENPDKKEEVTEGNSEDINETESQIETEVITEAVVTDKEKTKGINPVVPIIIVVSSIVVIVTVIVIIKKNK